MQIVIMKQLTPQNDVVLCTLVPNANACSNGIVYESKGVPMYKIEKLGPNVTSMFNVNDIIVTSTTGTKATLDNIDYFLFREKDIMGKIQ